MAITTTGGSPGTPLTPQSLTGKSAYQLAVDSGFTGTLSEWQASLAGVSGKSAYQSWLDVGNTGTEAEFVASLGGGGGAHPLLVTGKTGGTIGNICIPSASDPNVLVDVVNTMKGEIYDGAPLYYRRSATEVYVLGGMIPGTYQAGDVGKLIGLGDKTNPTASNLMFYPRGTLPSSLTPSANRVFLPLGAVESQTGARLIAGMPITEPDGAVQTYEAFSAVADGGTIPNTLLTSRWDTANETLSKFEGAIRQLTTAGSRRAVALMGPGTFTDGGVSLTFSVPAGQDMSGRAVRVYLRVSGENGTHTGIACDLNLGTGRLKTFLYNGGTGSSDLAITAGNAITGGAQAALTAGTSYRLEALVYGNRVLTRAYLAGGTPTDWLETYQNTVTGAGYAAFSGATGALDLRVASMAVTKNYGALKTAP